MKYDGSWTYEYCEVCLKNSHEKIKMERKLIFSADSNNKYFQEMWCCPKCGSTKRL